MESDRRVLGSMREREVRWAEGCKMVGIHVRGTLWLWRLTVDSPKAEAEFTRAIGPLVYDRIIPLKLEDHAKRRPSDATASDDHFWCRHAGGLGDARSDAGMTAISLLLSIVSRTFTSAL